MSMLYSMCDGFYFCVSCILEIPQLFGYQCVLEGDAKGSAWVGVPTDQ